MLLRQSFPLVRWSHPLPAGNGDAPGFRLPVDAWATDEALILTASVPGLGADQVEITLDDDVLIIRGEWKADAEEREHILRERVYGHFERRLTINVPVDGAAAEASVKDGVLRLVLPKAAGARPHRIAVQAVEA